MKNRKLLFFISLISLVISIIFVFLLSKKYFFNIFFEGKSLNYGYWPEGQDLDESNFGERGKDILFLKDLKNSSIGKILNSDKKKKISLIGDSFVWGNGVIFSKTVSQLLEKELSYESDDFEVLSFAMGGDSLLDHLAKIDILEKYEDIDLYIILVVGNDLLLRPSDNFYTSSIYQDLISKCNELYPDSVLIRHPSWDVLGEDKEEVVLNSYGLSFDSEMNNCVFSESLNNIKDKVKNRYVFLISDYHTEKSKEWSYILDIFIENNINYIDSSEGIHIPTYSSCWLNENSLKECFWVTENDRHPSEKLHKMYVDLLMDKIDFFIKY